MLRKICDAPQAALEERIDPRTGVLTLRYSPTWIGVREYQQEDGSISRELHRPEQVWSEGFLRTLRGLCCTLDHPSILDANFAWQPVWVHVDPDHPAPRGYVTRTPQEVGVGWTGDVIEGRPAPDLADVELPTLQVRITDQRAIDRIVRGGMSQSSLGYDTFVDRTPGIWVAPDGSEHPYDAEHVLDPDDPRVAAAVADGRMSLAEVAGLGANHFALLFRGRGAAQSALRLDGAGEIPLRLDLGEPRRFYLERNEDVHGKSGTGRVADGVLWADGCATIRWRTETASTTDFACLADLEAIHGHEGRTPIVWIDAPTPPVFDAAPLEAAPLAHAARFAPMFPYSGSVPGWAGWSDGPGWVAFWLAEDPSRGLVWGLDAERRPVGDPKTCERPEDSAGVEYVEDPFAHEHAARQRSPERMGGFRRIEAAPGISLILGKVGGRGPLVTQSVRFSAEQWTPAEARKWLEEHGYLYGNFEEAAQPADRAAPAMIGDVADTNTRKVSLPEVLRRSDAMISLEIPDDPALAAKLETVLTLAAQEIAKAREGMAMAESAASEAQAGMEAAQAAQAEMAGELEAMRADAAEGRKVALEAARAVARKHGLTPVGDSADAVRHEVVKARAPSAIAGYADGSPALKAAVDAAFRVIADFGVSIAPTSTPRADGLTPMPRLPSNPEQPASTGALSKRFAGIE